MKFRNFLFVFFSFVFIMLLFGCSDNDLKNHIHDWNNVEYTWSDDYSTCTATRICQNDPTHVETETVSTTTTQKAATCEVDGTTTYTAVFKNPAFKEQVKYEVISAPLEHVKENVSIDKENQKYTYVCSSCGKEIKEDYVDVIASGEYKASTPYDVVPGNTYYYHSSASTSSNYSRFKITESRTMIITVNNVDNAVRAIAMVNLYDGSERKITFTGPRGNSFKSNYSDIVAGVVDSTNGVQKITFSFPESYIGKYIVINLFNSGKPTNLLVSYGYMKPETKYPKLTYGETKSITLSGNYTEKIADSPDIYQFIAEETKTYSIKVTGNVAIYRMINSELDETPILIDKDAVEFDAAKGEIFTFIIVAPNEDGYSLDITIGDELPKVLGLENDVYFFINAGVENFVLITISDDVLENYYLLMCEPGSPSFARANVKFTLNDVEIYYGSLALMAEDSNLANIKYKAGDVLKIYGIAMSDIDGTLSLSKIE